MRRVLLCLALLAAFGSCAEKTPPGYVCGPSKMFCKAYKGDHVKLATTRAMRYADNRQGGSEKNAWEHSVSLGDDCTVHVGGVIEVIVTAGDLALVRYFPPHSSRHRDWECPEGATLLTTVCDVFVAGNTLPEGGPTINEWRPFRQEIGRIFGNGTQ